EEYFRCGILAHGFLRAQCESCHLEHLVAFSCKRRGICPSCGARRMSETAAHLVDSVLPMKNIRQWVLSFPIPIRLCLAVKPKIMSKALEITQAEISKYYRKKAGFSKAQGKTGAVTLIQRFGGSLNLNVHFHQLFIDGSYELGEQKEPIGFTPVQAPSKKELDGVLSKIIQRLVRYLENKKILIKDESDHLQISLPEGDGFTKIQSSSVTYRFATGSSKGKKAVVLKSLPERDHTSKSGLVAEAFGFSLHAGFATLSHERAKLEKICRYIARPAISEERLSLNCRGEVVYKLKKTWDDGTTAIKLTQIELMERLVALVPRPRVNLTRYHGVLAPNYKYRKQIVPQQKIEPDLKIVEPDSEPDPLAEAKSKEKQNAKKRMKWAQLLKRVFNIDIETCTRCGGKVKIIAAIEDPAVIKKILDHLGINSSPPKWTSARGPPVDTQPELFDGELFQAFPEY
ncbi:MAG TPA: transposase, partial [Pseudobdellovibrionaceae bacterium]|nr:transposase [Pseudobdellovibrionaceae bacterium]